MPLDLVFRLDQEAVALKGIRCCGQRREQLRRLGKGAAAFNPLDRFEIHLGALVHVACFVVRFAGKVHYPRIPETPEDVIDRVGIRLTMLVLCIASFIAAL